MEDAILFHDLHMIRQQFEDGDNPNLFMEQAIRSEDPRIVQLFLDFGAIPEGLPLAAALGDSEIVKMLLKHGAPEVQDALVEAVRMGHVNIVRMLLKRGAQKEPWMVQYALQMEDYDLARVLQRS